MHPPPCPAVPAALLVAVEDELGLLGDLPHAHGAIPAARRHAALPAQSVQRSHRVLVPEAGGAQSLGHPRSRTRTRAPSPRAPSPRALTASPRRSFPPRSTPSPSGHGTCCRAGGCLGGTPAPGGRGERAEAGLQAAEGTGSQLPGPLWATSVPPYLQAAAAHLPSPALAAAVFPEASCSRGSSTQLPALTNVQAPSSLSLSHPIPRRAAWRSLKVPHGGPLLTDTASRCPVKVYRCLQLAASQMRMSLLRSPEACGEEDSGHRRPCAQTSHCPRAHRPYQVLAVGGDGHAEHVAAVAGGLALRALLGAWDHVKLPSTLHAPCAGERDGGDRREAWCHPLQGKVGPWTSPGLRSDLAQPLRGHLRFLIC